MSLVAYTMRHLKHTLVFTLLYSTIFLAIPFDWMIWETTVNLRELVGIIVVVIGIMIKTYLTRRHVR